MDASPIVASWRAEKSALIDPCTDPTTRFHHRLEEVFHLD